MKTLKRVLSMAMALVLLVGGLAVLPTEAKGAEFTAALNFADRNWAYSAWTDTPVDGSTTTVSGSGTYSVTLDATKTGADGTTPCSGVQVFCFDIVGAITAGVSYEIESLKVTADGKEVAVDMSKVKTGDLEGKGNYRIEIYNEYGSTKEDSPIGDPTAFAFASTLTLEVTLKEVAAPAGGDAGSTGDVDLNQEFTAALNFADRNWAYSAWTDTPVDGSTTTVKGDGTYSVTLDATKTGADGTTPCTGVQVFCFDIVGSITAGVTYEIESLKVTADGKEVAVDMSKVKTGDLEEKGNYRIEIYNEYGSTKEDSPIGDPTAFAFASTLTVEVKLKAVAVSTSSDVDLNQEFTAALNFADRNWAYSTWTDTPVEGATTTVKGDGTYTVTLDATKTGADGTTPCAGVQVFCFDIIGAEAAGVTYKVEALKVTADGKEVAVDLSKVLVGDLEEKGNCRIEIFNEYGSTKDASPIGDATAFAFANTLTVEVTLKAVANGLGGTTEPEPTPEVDFDKNGKYNAYLGLQTPNWTYRNEWNTYEEGSELWGNFIYGNETSEKYGVVTDAVIEGNGTYRVSVVDFGSIIADDFSKAGQDYFNLLFISTDIPAGAAVQVTDVKLIIDGKTVHTDAEGFLDPDAKDYVKILIQNKWNAEKAEISFYNAPQKSLEMEFTISGFDYDKAVDEEPSGGNTEETPDTTPDAPTNNDGGIDPLVIVIVVVVVVAIVAGVVVVMKKKSK